MKRAALRPGSGADLAFGFAERFDTRSFGDAARVLRGTPGFARWQPASTRRWNNFELMTSFGTRSPPAAHRDGLVLREVGRERCLS
jgi:hypothetical protein